MHRYWLLQQVEYIVTTGLQRVKNLPGTSLDLESGHVGLHRVKINVVFDKN
jgi:hypothetical protein